MKQNDELELTITDISEEGKALGKYDGQVVFVKGAIPGDVVKTKITYTKKKFTEGKLLEILIPSQFRVNAKCKHFGICGGCSWQNLNYEQQLFYLG